MNLYPWLLTTFADVSERIASQQLHHGLLFVADKGVGESSLLSLIAKTLLCGSPISKASQETQTSGDSLEAKQACDSCKSCLLFNAQSHPDLKRVISDKPSIGVDLIRNASEFVTTTSQLRGNKVVIIEEIHLMTEAASNSLLKTLEEPSNNTYILLSTHKPDSLLPTITSRCEKLRVKLPSREASLAWLSKQSKEPVSMQGLQAYSDSPIAYLAALGEQGLNFAEFEHDIAALSTGKQSALAAAAKWQSEPAQVLAWTYRWSVNQYQQALLSDLAKAKLDSLQMTIDACHQANRKINQAGVNKSLLLQHVFNKVIAI